jgi:hypothetical protein
MDMATLGFESEQELKQWRDGSAPYFPYYGLETFGRTDYKHDGGYGAALSSAGATDIANWSLLQTGIPDPFYDESTALNLSGFRYMTLWVYTRFDVIIFPGSNEQATLKVTLQGDDDHPGAPTANWEATVTINSTDDPAYPIETWRQIRIDREDFVNVGTPGPLAWSKIVLLQLSFQRTQGAARHYVHFDTIEFTGTRDRPWADFQKFQVEIIRVLPEMKRRASPNIGYDGAGGGGAEPLVELVPEVYEPINQEGPKMPQGLTEVFEEQKLSVLPGTPNPNIIGETFPSDVYIVIDDYIPPDDPRHPTGGGGFTKNPAEADPYFGQKLISFEED